MAKKPNEDRGSRMEDGKESEAVKAAEQKFSAEVMQAAGKLYTAYCLAVGGKAQDGAPLPDWNAFISDGEKTVQSGAWLQVAMDVMAGQDVVKREQEARVAELEQMMERLVGDLAGCLGQDITVPPARLIAHLDNYIAGSKVSKQDMEARVVKLDEALSKLTVAIAVALGMDSDPKVELVQVTREELFEQVSKLTLASRQADAFKLELAKMLDIETPSIPEQQEIFDAIEELLTKPAPRMQASRLDAALLVRAIVLPDGERIALSTLKGWHEGGDFQVTLHGAHRTHWEAPAKDEDGKDIDPKKRTKMRDAVLKELDRLFGIQN